MKVLLFLSRFTLICNLCFLLFIFFRWMELKRPVTGTGDGLLPMPLIKELIIVLGFPAIVINFAMNITYLVIVLSGRKRLLPAWLPVMNALFLLLEIYYFFNY